MGFRLRRSRRTGSPSRWCTRSNALMSLSAQSSGSSHADSSFTAGERTHGLQGGLSSKSALHPYIRERIYRLCKQIVGDPQEIVLDGEGVVRPAVREPLGIHESISISQQDYEDAIALADQCLADASKKGIPASEIGEAIDDLADFMVGAIEEAEERDEHAHQWESDKEAAELVDAKAIEDAEEDAEEDEEDEDEKQ